MEPASWPGGARFGTLHFSPVTVCRYAPRAVVVNELFAGDEPVVEIVEEADGFAVGVLDRVALLRTRKPMEAESVDALFRVTTSLMQEYGPRLLYVVVPGALRPSVDPRAQERIVALWPKIQAQSLAGVMWIRGGGFNGALHRKHLSELLPHLRDRSLLGVTVSAWETVEYFLNHMPELEIDSRAWTHAFEQFAACYD